MADTDHLLKLQKKLADEGMLVGAGWIGFRMMALKNDAPADMLALMKMAFYAGSTHLFTSIMGILDPGVEETPGDMQRMNNIHDELAAFEADFRLRYGPAKGQG